MILVLALIGTYLIQYLPVFASVMENWFSHTIKEKPDSNAASKKHHKPSHIIVLWLVVRFPQFEIGILAKVENEGKNSPQILTANVEPSKFGYNICFPCCKWDIFSIFNAYCDKYPNKGDRGKRDNGIETECAQNWQLEFHP